MVTSLPLKKEITWLLDCMIELKNHMISIKIITINKKEQIKTETSAKSRAIQYISL